MQNTNPVTEYTDPVPITKSCTGMYITGISRYFFMVALANWWDFHRDNPQMGNFPPFMMGPSELGIGPK
jgi:hypothetical protein